MLTRHSHLLHPKTFCMTACVALALGCAEAVVSLQYPTHPQSVPAVSRLLSEDPLLQKEGRVEVLSLGEGATPELLRKMKDASPESRITIVEVATQIGKPPAVVGLIYDVAVRDTHVQVRQSTAFQGARAPQLAPSIIPPLRRLLSDPVPEVRAAAMTTLGGFKVESALSYEEITTAMRESNPLISATAASIALSRNDTSYSSELRRALPRLVVNLKDPKPATRAAVISAIGMYGEVAAPTVAPLSSVAARDPVPALRIKAAIALTRIGTPEANAAAQQTFEAFATSEDPALKAVADGYLNRNGVAPEQTAPQAK